MILPSICDDCGEQIEVEEPDECPRCGHTLCFLCVCDHDCEKGGTQ